MSSRVRRQRRRNYYHRRGDAFAILPVPSDLDAGPVTRAQLEKQARDLQSIGIYPAVSPRNSSYRRTFLLSILLIMVEPR
jgi:hypothetical protein